MTFCRRGAEQAVLRMQVGGFGDLRVWGGTVMDSLEVTNALLICDDLAGCNDNSSTETVGRQSRGYASNMRETAAGTNFYNP